MFVFVTIQATLGNIKKIHFGNEINWKEWNSGWFPAKIYKTETGNISNFSHELDNIWNVHKLEEKRIFNAFRQHFVFLRCDLNVMCFNVAIQMLSVFTL